MSSVDEEKAAARQGPVCAANALGLTGVHRVAISGSAQSVAVPAALRSHYVTFVVATTSADVQRAWSSGAAGQTLVLNQAAAFGTGNAAAGATQFSKTKEDEQVPLDATFLNFIGTAADGYLEVYVSEKWQG